MCIDLAHDFLVGDFLEMIGGDVLIFYYEEGVSAFDAGGYAVGIGADVFTHVV